MMTFFKFWIYWSLISVVMLIISFSMAGKDNDGLVGILGVLSFFTSGYMAFRLVRKKKENRSDSIDRKSDDDLGIQVRISSSSHHSNNYYEKEYSCSELENYTESLISNGKSSLQKILEVSLVENIDPYKKIVNALYRYYCKNDLQGWDISASPTILEFATFKFRPQVIELTNVAEKLTSTYNSMLLNLKSLDNFQDAGELDKSSMLDEFEDRFISDYVEPVCFECSFNEQDFMDVFVKSGFDEDLSIVDKYGYDVAAKIFDKCPYYFEKESRVFSVASGTHNYKEIKSLVDAGIVVNVDCIDPSELLRLLKISDIRELAKEKKITIKGRKKDDLISNFLELCEVTQSDVGKYIALREVFGISMDFISLHDFNSNYLTWKKYKLISNYVSERIEQVADAHFCEEKPRSSFNNKLLSKLSDVKAA